MEKLGLNEVGVVLQIHRPVTPLWILPTLDVDFNILKRIKTNKNISYQGIVKERLENHWQSYLQIYTDGA